MTTNEITKKSRNVILALLFLGWSLGNLDRYIMNYAVVSITGICTWMHLQRVLF